MIHPMEEHTNWLSNSRSALKTIHTSNSIWAEQVIFRNIYTHMHPIIISEKQAKNLKKWEVVYGRIWRERIRLELCYNIKNYKINQLIYLKIYKESREMWLKSHSSLPTDSHVVLSTYIRKLTTSYDSRCIQCLRTSRTSALVYTYPHIDTCTHNYK